MNENIKQVVVMAFKELKAAGLLGCIVGCAKNDYFITRVQYGIKHPTQSCVIIDATNKMITDDYELFVQHSLSLKYMFDAMGEWYIC